MLDDFILPLIGQKSPDYTEFYRALAVLGCIFIVGVIATFIYTRMMVYIGQGVLKRVRDDMFEHMQTLPIRYFDQNTNGSIMSLYTNDTDTLRQMISQAIPQALMSFFTIIVTFISMLVLSPLLTLLAIVVIGILVFVTKKIGGNSGKYFVRQQVSLADVTGFVEEHMNGQRVVKVFNHEQKSKEEFDQPDFLDGRDSGDNEINANEEDKGNGNQTTDEKYEIHSELDRTAGALCFYHAVSAFHGFFSGQPQTRPRTEGTCLGERVASFTVREAQRPHP